MKNKNRNKKIQRLWHGSRCLCCHSTHTRLLFHLQQTPNAACKNLLRATAESVCRCLLCENTPAAPALAPAGALNNFHPLPRAAAVPEDWRTEVKMKLWHPPTPPRPRPTEQRAPRLQLPLGPASGSHLHKCHAALTRPLVSLVTPWHVLIKWRKCVRLCAHMCACVCCFKFLEHLKWSFHVFYF